MVNILSKSLCESCFAETDTEPCPECGYQRSTYEHDRSVLPIGSVLEGRYMIGRVLGKGGFGITYLAYDMKLGYKVAVKEYYPMGAAVRDTENMTTVSTQSVESKESFRIGAEKFYSEARLVAELSNNPNIVNVSDVFYENDTVYFTMGYLEGTTLKNYIAKHGKISGDQAVYIAGEVSNALIAAHQKNVLHRDISPDNIMVCNNGTVKLLDFGAARQVYTEQSSSLSVILKQGYAPIEQYQKKGKQGPWTDIYALGATLYYSLTLDLLDDPMSRMDDDEGFSSNKHNISPALWEIIKKATMLRTSDRYQDVYDLLDALDDCGITPSPLVKTDDRSRRSFGSVSRRKMEYTEPAAMNETVALNENVAPAMDATVALNENAAPAMNPTVALNDSPAMDVTVALNNNSAPAMNPTVALNENIASDMNPTVALNNNAPDMNRTVALNDSPYPDMNVTMALNDHTSVVIEKKKNKFIIPGIVAAVAVIVLIIAVSTSSSDNSSIETEETTSSEVTEQITETENSQSAGSSDYSYEESGDGIKITKYNGGSSTVEIPDQIDGKPVIAIGSKAFSSNLIKNVIVPDSVTSILSYAFLGCKNLKSVSLPEGCITDSLAFYLCNDVKVEKRGGENASAEAPQQDRSEPEKPDQSEPSEPEKEEPSKPEQTSQPKREEPQQPEQPAENIDYSKLFTYETSEKGVTITGYTGSDSSVTIPAQIDGKPVIAVGDNAFFCCYGVTAVTISDGVSSIGMNAFEACTDLTSINIPGSVTSIGYSAFYSCYSLESINIPYGVTSIDENAFEECINLKSVTIPRSVTSIEQMTFANCTGLTEITIPDSVTSIKWAAFWGCSKLEKASIPSGCDVDSDAFTECRKVKIEYRN